MFLLNILEGVLAYDLVKIRFMKEKDGWMDGYFVYRRSTLKGHIASNKFYVI